MDYNRSRVLWNSAVLGFLRRSTPNVPAKGIAKVNSDKSYFKDSNF